MLRAGFITKSGVFLRWAALGLLAATLAGCASDDDAPYAAMPREPGRSVALDTHQKPEQCAPYAREHSSVKIFGDAWTWWDKAEGKFSRGPVPLEGAVMVLTDYAGPNHGHVAVVKRIVSGREIRVDHANWLDDGSIYLNDPVEDVSAGNDWSQVRVYNIKTGGWGSHIYPVQGFIGGSASDSVADGREAPRTGGKPNAASDSVPEDGIVNASVRVPPRSAPKPKTRPAPVRAPQIAPVAPPDTGDDSDPLPNPDMVVSANYPPGGQ